MSELMTDIIFLSKKWPRGAQIDAFTIDEKWVSVKVDKFWLIHGDIWLNILTKWGFCVMLGCHRVNRGVLSAGAPNRANLSARFSMDGLFFRLVIALFAKYERIIRRYMAFRHRMVGTKYFMLRVTQNMPLIRELVWFCLSAVGMFGLSKAMCRWLDQRENRRRLNHPAVLNALREYQTRYGVDLVAHAIEPPSPMMREREGVMISYSFERMRWLLDHHHVECVRISRAEWNGCAWVGTAIAVIDPDDRVVVACGHPTFNGKEGLVPLISDIKSEQTLLSGLPYELSPTNPNGSEQYVRTPVSS